MSLAPTVVTHPESGNALRIPSLGLCLIGLACSVWALVGHHAPSSCVEAGRILNCPLITSPAWTIDGLAVGWVGVVFFVVLGSLHLPHHLGTSGRRVRVIAPAAGIGVCAYLVEVEPLPELLRNGAFIVTFACVLALFTMAMTSDTRREHDAPIWRRSLVRQRTLNR